MNIRRVQIAKSLLLSLIIVMSLSTAVKSFIIDCTSSTVSDSSAASMPEFFSSFSRSQTPLKMGAEVDVPFCAEAFAGSNVAAPRHVRINRLEYANGKMGHDVSSARGWMEHIEQCDGQLYGVGAYTVIRCDASYNKHNCNWKIWGLEFHMKRLFSSYRMLMESLGCDFDGGIAASCEKEPARRSDCVINSLLDEAALSLRESIQDSHHFDLQMVHFSRTLMLTVLWTPSRINAISISKESESMKPIIIRGHATFSCAPRPQLSTEDLMPSPISACLAIPSVPTAEAMSLMPRRHRNDDSSHPQPTQMVAASAKISSWCRIRRPLEDSTKFKVPGSGVGEVLLVGGVRNRDFDGKRNFFDSLEILEGLVTNFFVIYSDCTVRTAPLPKVLSGYARYLVLDVIKEVQDLVLDDSNAPTVQDAIDGLWSEVFVTSSIKLIVPVNRVLIPPVKGMESSTLWQSKCRATSDYPFTQLIWSGIMRGEYMRGSPCVKDANVGP
jgi:hypothetical protein